MSFLLLLGLTFLSCKIRFCKDNEKHIHKSALLGNWGIVSAQKISYSIIIIIVTAYLTPCSFSIKWVCNRFLLNKCIQFTSSCSYNKGRKMVSFIHNPVNQRKRAPGIRNSEGRSKPGFGKLQPTGQIHSTA